MSVDSELVQVLSEREGVSFGLTLTPFLIQQANRLASPPPLPDPELTGSLSANEIDTLYSIAIYAGTKWQLTGQSAFDKAEFEGFLCYKSQQTPSYFTAYKDTLALYQTLVAEIGAEAALDYLYTPNPSTPPADWDVTRYWAIRQFLILFVTSGNFRSYGWVNFPGWMGGPYSDPSNLPYRGIND